MLDSVSKSEINKIFLNGKKLKGKYFNLFIIDKIKPEFKFSVIISGKCKPNERIKLKRRLREIIRTNKADIKHNFILLIRREYLKFDFVKLKEIVLKQLKEFKIL